MTSPDKYFYILLDENSAFIAGVFMRVSNLLKEIVLTKNYNEQKQERLNLYWLCQQSGRRHPAGVAFFNEEQGDFRLKVDILPEDKNLYLKATSVSTESVFYRVESVVRKAGAQVHRTEVGTGYARKDDPKVIYMDIGPFSRTLVLDQNN